MDKMKVLEEESEDNEFVSVDDSDEMIEGEEDNSKSNNKKIIIKKLNHASKEWIKKFEEFQVKSIEKVAKMEYDNKTGINKVDNKTLGRTKGLVLRVVSKVEKETSWNYQKYAEWILNELDLEEDSMNDKALDKSNYEMLVRANQEQQSSIENDGSNMNLLVSKINDEDKDKKMDDLPELDREVIQNIKWDVNGEVVMPEIGDESMNAADMDNEIADNLFNPEGKCLTEHPV
ncbi:36126_t:CDS:2 [Gigaspora margarita]|uniref:36126_t:CDS:1 n=1 Tax=Gigaspora margarita TaxID=4874 RepID=A0ABN7UIB5_GIGMA|nr:36126_t:CDS:2 [Gigaspora margarita]